MVMLVNHLKKTTECKSSTQTQISCHNVRRSWTKKNMMLWGVRQATQRIIADNPPPLRIYIHIHIQVQIQIQIHAATTAAAIATQNDYNEA